MTPDESNLTIARLMAKDPDEEWRRWAHDRCPECRGTGWDNRSLRSLICPHCCGRPYTPRDFGDPSNTLKLVEWATRQTWYNATLTFDGYEGSASLHVAWYVRAWVNGRIGPSECACQVRDIIAQAAKEAGV